MGNRTIPRIRKGALAAAAALWASALIAQAPATVILVRHAERAGGMEADVGITEAGQARARVLAAMLADAGIRRIFTSEVARTRQTAEPLARKLGIQPEVVAAKDVVELVAKLRSGAPGSVTLVVGHSNTLPDILARLGARPGTAIADNEYDRLYVVTLTGGGQASAVMLRYPGSMR